MPLSAGARLFHSRAGCTPDWAAHLQNLMEKRAADSKVALKVADEGEEACGLFSSASSSRVHIEGRSERAAKSARYGVRLYGTLFRAGAVCLTALPVKS